MMMAYWLVFIEINIVIQNRFRFGELRFNSWQEMSNDQKVCKRVAFFHQQKQNDVWKVNKHTGKVLHQAVNGSSVNKTNSLEVKLQSSSKKSVAPCTLRHHSSAVAMKKDEMDAAHKWREWMNFFNSSSRLNSGKLQSSWQNSVFRVALRNDKFSSRESALMLVGHQQHWWHPIERNSAHLQLGSERNAGL